MMFSANGGRIPPMLRYKKKPRTTIPFWVAFGILLIINQPKRANLSNPDVTWGIAVCTWFMMFSANRGRIPPMLWYKKKPRTTIPFWVAFGILLSINQPKRAKLSNPDVTWGIAVCTWFMMFSANRGRIPPMLRYKKKPRTTIPFWVAFGILLWSGLRRIHMGRLVACR